MAPDERTLRTWIREAQAKLALQDFTPRQKAQLARTQAESKGDMGPVKNAIRDLLRATKASDLQAALVHVQEALATLRGMAEAEDAEGVKETLASLARHQTDQMVHLGLRESQLKAYLARPSPPPRPGEETAEGKMATRFVEKEVLGWGESAEVTALQRKLDEELRRAKRG